MATKTRKTYLVFLAAVALISRAQAVPLTQFLPNATGGFDAFVYPELTNGTPSLQGGIFTLPQAVNPGYVVILASPNSRAGDVSSWVDVIHFFNNGAGIVNSMQMLMGGPAQSTYFPSFKTVLANPHSFIVRGSDSSGFTTFTQYSVKTRVTRNYHFYTLGPLSVPEGGSTLLLLSLALAALIIHLKLRRA